MVHFLEYLGPSSGPLLTPSKTAYFLCGCSLIVRGLSYLKSDSFVFAADDSEAPWLIGGFVQVQSVDFLAHL